MNEIVKIHLGRQSFTIAVDAHKLLQAYLAAIKHQVGDKAADIIEEVELRMAELLSERGITADKVVLVQDVVFLKAQLGEPGDFKEDATDDETAPDDEEATGPKRLFRDTENGWLAGVAAGLSAYSGVPVMLIRILFVGLAFASGVGILIYLLLWFVLPETKSPSDYLQMKGLAVNVDNLKRVIDQADFQGAAQRAGHVVGHVWCRLTWIASRILGVGFILFGIGLLALAATATSYLLVHGLQLANTVLFPVGSREIMAVICGLVALVLMAIMLAITGRAMLSRRWTFPTWALAAVIASFVLATSVGTALGLAVAPTVDHRYAQLQHSAIRELPSFKYVNLQGGPGYVVFRSATDYSLEIRYIGTVNPKAITTKVVGDTLQIDASRYNYADHEKNCSFICPFGDADFELIVYEPASDLAPGLPAVPPAKSVVPSAPVKP